MRVLLACEESQAVCKEFRALGHEAYSCDIQPCSGGHPEWHIKGDALELLKLQWDLLIAFPPCTYLSYAGNGHLNSPGRKENREEAMAFFMEFVNANVPHICIENPMGYPFKAYRKPDQIINPYFFGDPHLKRTCLWLKNLPLLFHTDQHTLFDTRTHVDKPEPVYVDASGKRRHFTDSISGGKGARKARSKTFPGIAKAMADQWGTDLLFERALPQQRELFR